MSLTRLERVFGAEAPSNCRIGRPAYRKALICFLTCGDPDLNCTIDLVKAVAAAGADIVELGIPFSDPLADGPTIQSSSYRALQAGTTVSDVIKCVEAIREASEVPLVLMTYFNPVYNYGLERFANDAASAGADGVIMTDLPIEEIAQWKSVADTAELATVLLVAPTSTKERIERIAKMASGFIYCVSRTGVTGAGDTLPGEVVELVNRTKSVTDLPVVVGFGISKPEHVNKVLQYADGAVVGSALVDLIARHHHTGDVLERVSEFVRSLKG
ncbi:MAG: tryptophan synthase subunit alpha [Armatimonadota bacterium]|nr:tryptophan synthase subunit alpha [Armatimonadota bacterium]